ncbi:hypothetical protein [Patiriisocius sp. Uisw_017]|jgi:hypothetical protein|uniref:hypothetical protein n=1 Tax=Patiriisocius sp. Uisw_017 TaxID=3230968 RepID=UPI0039E9F2BA
MTKFTCLIALSFLIFSCNDGDIILSNFDFEDAPLENCGEAGSYVFYKINPDVNESISVLLNTTGELFITTGVQEFPLSEDGNTVQYRAFSDLISGSYFCSPIPPSSPTVVTEYIGTSGNVLLDSETTLDDNDGLETVDSTNPELEGTGDFDLDGIPNFHDFDDDGDNVSTLIELGPDPENPTDTDGDGMPNYLDPDDDNDGILTRNEDRNEDLNPANDAENNNDIPDYLNPDVAVQIIVEEYKPHNYSRMSIGKVRIDNLVLINGDEEITIETLNLGTDNNIRNDMVTATPVFN